MRGAGGRGGWWPLVDGPFRLADAAHAALYRRGLLPRRRLDRPTVSVGALHAGGAGKTPMAMDLAGPGDAILLRGYGGRSAGPRAVAAAGGDPGAPPWSALLRCGGDTRPARAWSRDIGDEAALIAALRPDAVVGVGPDRAAAAAAVARHHRVRRFILDDGLAHHRLHRDLDLVCLPVVAAGGRGGLQLRPGFRRHGTGVLARVHAAVVIGDARDPLDRAAVEALARSLGFDGVLGAARKVPGALWSYPDGDAVAPAELHRRPAAVLCAIGDPGSFIRLARRHLSLRVVERRTAADHHRFREDELAEVERSARRRGASLVLTTAKDAVRLPESWAPRLPWMVLEPRLCWDGGRTRLRAEVDAL